MKKFSIIAIAFLIMATSAFAQGRRNNHDSDIIRDGRTIIRINVGDDRDERDLLRRVHRLEQAVRDLQDKIYELNSSREIKVCSGDFFTIGTVIAKAPSELEARAIVMTNCQRKGGGIFCKEKDIKCTTSIE